MFLFSSNGLEELLQDNQSICTPDLIHHPQDEHYDFPVWVLTQHTYMPIPDHCYMYHDDGERPLKFAVEYHLQEVPGVAGGIKVLQKIVRVKTRFWKNYEESTKVLDTLLSGGVPTYKEKKNDLMTERKMVIGVIPILHEFVYNVDNQLSFVKLDDYLVVDTRSDNWFGRYPEEPEMSLNREFDAIRNRCYDVVPTIPDHSNRVIGRFDNVSYWTTEYIGQEKWQRTHRLIDEQCKRFGLTNFQEPTRVMCSYTPQGKSRDELCTHCNYHPCVWLTNSEHIVHNVKTMRGGDGYENNERRWLAYRLGYYILHGGYSARYGRIRLPECMTTAIQKEWPTAPGQEYRGFIRRRRPRTSYPKPTPKAILKIAAVKIGSTPVKVRKMAAIKIEPKEVEVIEIDDSE